MDNILDAELAWERFFEDFAGDDPSRYIRINPNIGHDPPAYDDVEQMKILQREVHTALSTPQLKAQIEQISHALVASSFFYEKTTVRGGANDQAFLCSGWLSLNTHEYHLQS
jgi:hypothetical protein